MSNGKERVTEESNEQDIQEDGEICVTDHHKNGFWVDFDSPRSKKIKHRDTKNSMFLSTDHHNWLELKLSCSSSNKPQDADYATCTPSLSYELEGLILARFPRSEYWKLSFVNKRFASLVKNTELFKIRRDIGFNEPSVLMLASGENSWWAFDRAFTSRRRLPVIPSDICFTSGDKESLCAGTHLLVSGREIEGLVIWRYELASNKWFKGPDMINPRCLFASATCRNSAFVAGGTSGTQVVYDKVEKYDPETRIWTCIPRMTRPRKLCSGCYMDNKFYAIGGRNDGGELTCGEYYDEEKRQWTLIPGMLKGDPVLSCHSPPLIAVVKNELYCIEACSNQLKVYLKKSNSWKQLGLVPVRADYNRGWGVAFKSFGDELVVIGASTELSLRGSMGVYACRPEAWAERVLEWKLLDDGKIQLSHFIMNCSVMVA